MAPVSTQSIISIGMQSPRSASTSAAAMDFAMCAARCWQRTSLNIWLSLERSKPQMSSLSPAYKAGLAARNRLTDARDEVHRLRDHLPDEKRRDLIALYNQLCSVQGTLEALLEDVPTTVPDNGEPAQPSSNGNRDVNMYLPSAAAPICLPVTKMPWTSEAGQQLVSLQLRVTDQHTSASALA